MTVVLWIISLAALCVGILPVVLWVLYAPVAARALAEMPWFPSRRIPMPLASYNEGTFKAEEVRFRTADGSQLAGTYLPTTACRRRGVVIFCHELGGTRRTALAFTSGLRVQGFDILTFDFRNHGESGTSNRKPTPWATVRETEDVEAAISFCCRRDATLAGRVALFGLSRGASAALCVAAGDSRVRGAVLDSTCFTQQVQLFLIRRFMHFHLRFFPWLSRLPDPLMNMLVFWMNRIIERRQGCRILSVGRAARRIRKPVLLIHGGRDALVPLETVCSVRKGMPCRPRLWVVSQARHNESVHEAGEDYGHRVARFLVRHMAVPLDVTGGSLEGTFAPSHTGPCDDVPSSRETGVRNTPVRRVPTSPRKPRYAMVEPCR